MASRGLVYRDFHHEVITSIPRRNLAEFSEADAFPVLLLGVRGEHGNLEPHRQEARTGQASATRMRRSSGGLLHRNRVEYLVMRSKQAFARRFDLDASGNIPRFYQYLKVVGPREDQRAVGTGWSFELRKALPFAGLPARRYQRHLGSPVRFTRTSARSSRSLTRGSRSATKYLNVRAAPGHLPLASGLCRLRSRSCGVSAVPDLNRHWRRMLRVEKAQQG